MKKDIHFKITYIQKRLSLIILILTAGLLHTINCVGQWSSNTSVNNAICTASNYQMDPIAISDGSGGAIIAWTDKRINTKAYVQRINSAGVVQWTQDGVAVCPGSDYQTFIAITSDGAGGVIAAWSDSRSDVHDIYVQRFNASGAALWPANGVALTTAPGFQAYPVIASDGSGGAIVSWVDARYTAYRIYAQRVNADGVLLWNKDGVDLKSTETAAAATQGPAVDPRIVSNGSGGAIIAWTDSRKTVSAIYAQSIDALGVLRWTEGGVALCEKPSYAPKITSDGSGGAIVVWSDHRNDTYDVYAQRINASGIPQWMANGAAICTAAGDQSDQAIVSDGTGGAIMAWNDFRNNIGIQGFDIYAQRINRAGAVNWAGDGVAVCTALEFQLFPNLVSDGSEGAIITWQDLRAQTHKDIYAQRLNESGLAMWASDGLAVSTAAGNQLVPALVSDDNAGAIVTWQDGRNEAGDDIYAGHVNGIISGTDDPSESGSIFSVYPNPNAGNFFIKAEPGKFLQAEIINSTGQLIQLLDLKTELTEVNHFPQGLYLVKIGNRSIKLLVE